MGVIIFYIFGTLLLDLISKMASRKKRKLNFEVPLTTTSISMVISGLQRVAAVYFLKPDNYMSTFFLPNTLKWIVVQKLVVHLANKHNESKKIYQLKKLREKRLKQHEAAQLQKRVKITLNYLECPKNIESQKQFEIFTKREKMDEGVYLIKKAKPYRKVAFSPLSYNRAHLSEENFRCTHV